MQGLQALHRKRPLANKVDNSSKRLRPNESYSLDQGENKFEKSQNDVMALEKEREEMECEPEEELEVKNENDEEIMSQPEINAIADAQRNGQGINHPKPGSRKGELKDVRFNVKKSPKETKEIDEIASRSRFEQYKKKRGRENNIDNDGCKENGIASKLGGNNNLLPVPNSSTYQPRGAMSRREQSSKLPLGRQVRPSNSGATILGNKLTWKSLFGIFVLLALGSCFFCSNVSCPRLFLTWVPVPNRSISNENWSQTYLNKGTHSVDASSVSGTTSTACGPNTNISTITPAFSELNRGNCIETIPVVPDDAASANLRHQLKELEVEFSATQMKLDQAKQAQKICRDTLEKRERELLEANGKLNMCKMKDMPDPNPFQSQS